MNFMKDVKIYETRNFLVEAAGKPHIDRDEGGHIVIRPKVGISTRQELFPNQAVELMRLTIVVGEAMTKVMNELGVNIGRINYQDNGNWGVFKSEGPKLHVHLYGRAKNAKIQKYGQACYFPHIDEEPDYYKEFKPLNDATDIKAIKEEIEKLFKEDKFSNRKWGYKF